MADTSRLETAVARRPPRVGAGLSTLPSGRAAAGAALDQALATLEGVSADLVLLFVSPQFEDEIRAITDLVSERTDDAVVIGCSAGGVIGGRSEVEDAPAISVWAAALPGGGLRPFRLTFEREGEHGAIDGLEEIPPGDLSPVVVMMADPFSFPSDLLLEHVNERAPGVPGIGGPASGGLEELTVRLRTPEEIKLQPGALGISSIEVSASGPRVERGLGEAVAVGAARTVQAFRFILDGLGQLAYQIVTQPTEPPPAAGPIGIAQEIGRIFWEEGLIPTLQIAGILSANLALVNILPFPPLDGGRMLFLVIKAVAGARVSIRAERLTYIVGFLFLFGFLIWISAFDIARLGGIVP